MRKRTRVLLGVVVSAILAGVVGCMSRSSEAPMSVEAPYEADSLAGGAPGGMVPQAPPSRAASMAADEGGFDVGEREESRGAPADADKSNGPASGEDGGQATAPAKPTPRLVHYNGYAQLRVTRPTETLDEVVRQAVALGGYVERLGSDSVTVRVPVARFEETFAAFLRLGDILQRSITAQDVTDSLTEIGLRLETAKATRDRLIELLARARNEHEKLELLRQIQRVTEEIDRLESQVRTLVSLASYSRITIAVVQREALAARSVSEEVAEFRWIQQLSPFRQDVAEQGKRLELSVPDGMVALDVQRRFVAESADGARLWTTKLPNRPEGTTAFWLDALELRLAAEFEKAERGTLGGFATLRLVDRSEEPYTYVVGIRAEGKDLELVEVYYPSSDQETRYQDAVSAAIRGGGRP